MTDNGPDELFTGPVSKEELETVLEETETILAEMKHVINAHAEILACHRFILSKFVPPALFEAAVKEYYTARKEEMKTEEGLEQVADKEAN